MSRRWQILLACALAAVAACTADPTRAPRTGPPYEVSSKVLRDKTTQEIRVWAPVEKGTWPVVYALPGISGHKSDFDRLGPALARQGVVVFATDYRTHGTLRALADDLGCGYRFARRAADEYGGDLNAPVTGVGYSFGAFWMVYGALQKGGGAGSQGDTCTRDLPKPDVVVGVNGCYYAWRGWRQQFPVAELDRREADVLLVAAAADRTCPAWESKKAAAALSAAGFRTTLTTIPGANHYTPIFHDLVQGEWVSVPEAPAGERTVQEILDAINAKP